MPEPTNDYYLDGNTILELDYENERYRFWPDSGSVNPGAREWVLSDMDAEFWRDATSDDLNDIDSNATELMLAIEQGRTILRR